MQIFDEKMMAFAPIVVFAYNRPRHLNNLFESLLSCLFIEKSKIYVFSMLPKI